MIANFFGKSKPINYLVIFGLFMVYFFLSVFSDLLEVNFSIDFVLNKLEALGVFLAIFFVFNFLVLKNKLTLDNSYGYLFFTISSGFFLKGLQDFKILAMFFLTLLLMRRVFSLFSRKAIFQKLFDSGLLLGVLFVLEPYTILFSILLFIGVYGYQKLTIRFLLIPLLGFVIPIFLYYTYCVYNNSVIEFTNLFSLKTSYINNVFTQYQFQIPLVFIGILVFVAILFKSVTALQVNNSFRKNWILIVLNFLVSILFIVFISDKQHTELLFLLFPSSIILANGFQLLKNKLIKDILLMVLLLISFIFPFAL